MNEKESWRDIPSADGAYQASTLGRIRNAGTGRILKPWLAGYGYQYVGLGRARRSTVHRLVCEAFHGPMEGKQTDVAHFDGDRLNNRPENLRWATRAENTADAIRHGTTKLNQFRTDGHKPRHRPNPRRGVDAPSAKLDPERASQIRRRYSDGEKMPSLAREFGVGKSTIFRVLKGAIWT